MQTNAYFNPVAPSTAPTVDQLTDAYAKHAALIRGEAVDSAPQVPSNFNPYAPQQDTSQQDDQQQHISNIEQFLAPVGGADHNTGEGMSDAHYQRWAKNLYNDPAFKEFGDQMHEFASTVRNAYQNGTIGFNDVRDMIQDYGTNVIAPIIEKHHGKHSDSYHTSLHDDVQEELPEIVKKVKGAK